MTTTLKKNKKAVAAVGIAAAAAAVLALGAGTYAGFFDEADGPNVTAAAGTLFFDDAAASAEVVTLDAPAPGDTDESSLTYRNGGSLPGLLKLTFEVEDLENGCAGGPTGPEAAVDPDCAEAGDVGELSKQVYVTITPTDASGQPIAGLDTFEGTVYSLEGRSHVNYSGYSVPVDAGQEITFDFEFEFLDDATHSEVAQPTYADFVNNAAQGDAFTLSSDATLTQAP